MAGQLGPWPQGSSPRIRGEWAVLAALNMPAWIIPANTGRISDDSDDDSHTADHPREYGENSTGFQTRKLRNGSSPRIRGELVFTVDDP